MTQGKDSTGRVLPEDPMIPFDLEESSKRMYLHLRRKESLGQHKITEPKVINAKMVSGSL